MKNQYFGDKRDFFKFDLVLTLIEHLKPKRSFTYIPMLTPPDDECRMTPTGYSATRNKGLYNFLQECAKFHNRNIINLRFFMRQQGIRYHPYHDAEYFLEQERETYFCSVDASLLDNSVIMVDPDTGIEAKPETMRGKENEYIRCSDLLHLQSQMSDSSILTIFQAYRDKPENCFLDKGKRIVASGYVNNLLATYYNPTMFFILSRRNDVAEEARRVIEQHCPEYRILKDENLNKSQTERERE